MPSKRIDKYENVYQRNSVTVLLSKNDLYTQPSTEGLELTAWLVPEAYADTGLGAINVTKGSPTGEPENTDIVFEIDVLTGIQIDDRKWFELILVNEEGVNMIPNKVTGKRVMLELVPQPSPNLP